TAGSAHIDVDIAGDIYRDRAAGAAAAAGVRIVLGIEPGGAFGQGPDAVHGGTGIRLGRDLEQAARMLDRHGAGRARIAVVLPAGPGLGFGAQRRHHAAVGDLQRAAAPAGDRVPHESEGAAVADGHQAARAAGAAPLIVDGAGILVTARSAGGVREHPRHVLADDARDVEIGLRGNGDLHRAGAAAVAPVRIVVLVVGRAAAAAHPQVRFAAAVHGDGPAGTGRIVVMPAAAGRLHVHDAAPVVRGAAGGGRIQVEYRALGIHFHIAAVVRRLLVILAGGRQA